MTKKRRRQNRKIKNLRNKVITVKKQTIPVKSDHDDTRTIVFTDVDGFKEPVTTSAIVSDVTKVSHEKIMTKIKNRLDITHDDQLYKHERIGEGLTALTIYYITADGIVDLFSYLTSENKEEQQQIIKGYQEIKKSFAPFVELPEKRIMKTVNPQTIKTKAHGVMLFAPGETKGRYFKKYPEAGLAMGHSKNYLAQAHSQGKHENVDGWSWIFDDDPADMIIPRKKYANEPERYESNWYLITFPDGSQKLFHGAQKANAAMGYSPKYLMNHLKQHIYKNRDGFSWQMFTKKPEILTATELDREEKSSHDFPSLACKTEKASTKPEPKTVAPTTAPESVEPSVAPKTESESSTIQTQQLVLDKATDLYEKLINIGLDPEVAFTALSQTITTVEPSILRWYFKLD